MFHQCLRTLQKGHANLLLAVPIWRADLGKKFQLSRPQSECSDSDEAGEAVPSTDGSNLFASSGSIWRISSFVSDISICKSDNDRSKFRASFLPCIWVSVWRKPK
mmetsp:Transcript_44448/g.96657  ORF Transcript_44448/g.96657 Transcript_44448/m.96657 type:complete len:105 (+) Transcript_44448:14-328(+)